MTKSHLLLYIFTILAITTAAYLYTSVAEAPHGLTTEPKEEDQNETQIIEVVSTSTKPQEENVEEPTLIAPTDLSVLEKRDWQWLVNEDLSTGVEFKPKKPEAFVLRFDGERLSSQTDCNNVGASYTSSGKTITIGAMMSTLMYCENSDEAVYTKTLSEVTSFVLSGNSLKLKTDSGLVMVFESKI